MTARVDKIISKIHECHRRYLEEGLGKRDAMIFSHGEPVLEFVLPFF